MKAAVYSEPGPPGVLRYIDVQDPVLSPEDVLIAVEAISIEGGDLINRRLATPPAPNHILGYAAAGTITAIGADVKNRRVGDRVTSFDLAGSHANLRVVKSGRTWLVPPDLDMSLAAALPISFGTAHHCLHARARLEGQETVLVLAAAGGVGLASVQLAHEAGAKVIAVTSGPERIARLLRFGADHVIDRKTENVVEATRSLTSGKGVEVVIDPVGSTLEDSLAALAPEGRLVFVGNAGGGDLPVHLMQAMQDNQSLLGVFMGTQLDRPHIHATVDRMLEAAALGKLKVVIDRTFSLADAAAAHDYAENNSPFGRVVLVP